MTRQATLPLPTVELLRNALRYEPETGKLFWNKRADAPRNWNSKYAGKEAFTAINDSGYLIGGIGNKKLRAHRVIWAIVYGAWPAHEIDHINMNKTDNQIENLREATHSQNQCNKLARSDNTSGFKGVSWHKQSKKWRVRIGRGNASRSLGYFDNILDAASAYDLAKSNWHGEFARSGK